MLAQPVARTASTAISDARHTPAAKDLSENFKEDPQDHDFFGLLPRAHAR
jgi:hypothetical protein